MSRYEDLNSHVTPASGVSVQFWRVGKVAYIKAEGSAVALAEESFNVLANINTAAYRPINYIYGMGYMDKSGGRVTCETSVTSDGRVRIFNTGAAATCLVRLSLVFPIS